ncbi:hypothetical protein LINPERPRIM_LOCUS25013 [Linum perenne]
MEGIHFTCFIPKPRCLPSFVLRIKEVFQGNNIFNEDVNSLIRHLQYGASAKMGVIGGSKDPSNNNVEDKDESKELSGNNIEDRDEPHSSHASSAKRPSGEDQHYQLDDNEIVPSDAEETHVVTDNEGHSASSNNTSHEADSPHGYTTSMVVTPKMTLRCKDKSNKLKGVSTEEVACRDEVARLEAALIAERGKMVEILARKNTITLDLNEIMKEARSIQDKEKTLMSVEEITLKKEQVFQTRAANIANIINLKTIVEDIL